MAFQQNAWELATANLLRSRYTPPHTSIAQFQRVEEMMYEAVLELRRHSAGTLNAECGKSGLDVDDNGFPLNLRTPSSIMLNNVTSLVGYLSAIFAFQTPPFGVTPDPSNLHVTTAVREKLTRDSFKGRWTLHLMKAIMNAATFNYAPMRQWVDSRTNAIQLRALDPYNTVVDSSVPYEELGTRGSYAYTVEMMSLATLYSEILTYPAANITTAGNAIIENILDVYAIPPEIMQMGNAYIQGGGYVDYAVSSTTDWHTFGTDEEFKGKKPVNARKMYRDGNHFAVTTYFVRALPSWLGLDPKQYGGTYDVQTGSIPCYRALMLGDMLLAIAPESTELNQFSLSVGAVRIQSSGAVHATYAELLMPHQVAATKLDNARYSAIRRMLGRSGIYNAELIDAATLNAKHVRMRKGREGEQILVPQQAFMHDSVDGNALNALIGEYGQMEYLASNTVGNTPQMRGQRTKGNKLAGEAAMEATYAEAPFRVHAMVFQETLVAALREQLKHNLRLAIRDLSHVDKVTGIRSNISISDYTESSLSFDVSDGASPASKLISPDAIGTLLSNLAQMPILQQLFDLRTLYNMFAISLGVTNIDSVPTPDAAQQQLMRLAQEAESGVAQQTQQQVQQEEPAPQPQQVAATEAALA